MFNNFFIHLSKRLVETNPFVPRIYVLHNIHEDGAPLRLIIKIICGSTYLLAKLLDQKLTPLGGLSSSSIKYSYLFINEIKFIRLNPFDIIVIFYMIYLYANIPVNEVVDIMKLWIL